jgi:hypothetical protein
MTTRDPRLDADIATSAPFAQPTKKTLQRSARSTLSRQAIAAITWKGSRKRSDRTHAHIA